MALPSRSDQTWAAAPGTADGALLGRNTTSKVGVDGAVPVVRTTLPAAATDAATTQALANAIRAMLIARGDAV